MKKLIVVIVVIVLVGISLTAAAPHNSKTLFGTLQWKPNYICGAADYVPTEAMVNVYLTGKFTPTDGLLQGCHIVAIGSSYTMGPCSFFAVDKYTVSCSSDAGGGR